MGFGALHQPVFNDTVEAHCCVGVLVSTRYLITKGQIIVRCFQPPGVFVSHKTGLCLDMGFVTDEDLQRQTVYLVCPLICDCSTATV